MGEVPKLPPDPLVGKPMGRARLERRLAQGGMAVLYFGTYGQGNSEVAVKVLAPELIQDSSSIERFHREAEAAQRIHHPNVVRVMEAGQEGQYYFIIMEFVKGEPLHAVIRREGRLDFESSTRIARDIGKALQAAHEQGVIHRDIKPENVIIDPEGTVKLTDFGIARDLAKPKGLTAPGLMVGTPEFMSPEQVEGPELDHRTDLYSLGITYYLMLTGRYPFEGDSDVAVAMARLKGPPLPVQRAYPQVDPRCVPILEKLLARSPEQRYRSAKDAVAAMEKALYAKGDSKKIEGESLARFTKAMKKGPAPAPKGKDTFKPTIYAHAAPVPKLAVLMSVVSLGLFVAVATMANQTGARALAAIVAEHAVPATIRLGLLAGAVGAAIMALLTGLLGARGRDRLAAGAFVLAGGLLLVLGGSLARPIGGVGGMLASTSGLFLLGLGWIAAVAVAAYGGGNGEAKVVLRRLWMAAGLLLAYAAGPGFAGVLQPLKGFVSTPDTTLPLFVALAIAGGVGSWLLTREEGGFVGRTAGLLLSLLAAWIAYLLGALGGGAVNWPAAGRRFADLAAPIFRGLVADGGLLAVASTIWAVGFVLYLKPVPRR